MSTPLLHLTADRLDAAAVGALVSASDPGRAGAVVTFVGEVRRNNAGRVVTRLEYEAFEPLALKTFRRIADETADHWPSIRLALHHRLGRLLPGEASVVVAAAAPHRSEAFRACRYVIERVKQIAPIWKHEYFEGGDVWIEGATADPTDESASRAALEAACGS